MALQVPPDGPCLPTGRHSNPLAPTGHHSSPCRDLAPPHPAHPLRRAVDSAPDLRPYLGRGRPASRTMGGRRRSRNSTYGGNVTEATRTADGTSGAAVDV